MGGGALSISILVHVALLIIGAFWVLQIIREPEKKVDFMPASGGGGAPESQQQQKKQRNVHLQESVSRVAAVGVESSISLPDPDMSSAMTSLGNLGGGSLSKGMGGNGSGGGKGNGTGTGFGDGMGPGMGNGTGLKSPFGMLEAAPSALLGTFYDLKQTKDKKPTNMTDDEMRLTVREIVSKGFKERTFDKYYHATQKLYQTKLYMPFMRA